MVKTREDELAVVRKDVEFRTRERRRHGPTSLMRTVPSTPARTVIARSFFGKDIVYVWFTRNVRNHADRGGSVACRLRMKERILGGADAKACALA